MLKRGDWGSPQQAAKGTLGDLSGAKNAQCTSLRCLPTLGQDIHDVKKCDYDELKRRSADISPSSKCAIKPKKNVNAHLHIVYCFAIILASGTMPWSLSGEIELLPNLER